MPHPKCIELRERCYIKRGWRHAYQHYQDTIAEHLDKHRSILDLGCGRAFPMAERFLSWSDHVYGIDPIAEPAKADPCATVKRGTADNVPFPDANFDVVVCRAVLEHLGDPRPVFKEVSRVLAPGGVFIFLTPSRYDYVSLAARALPNSWHPWIVRRLEGRDEADTFPTYYRANSQDAVESLAAEVGLGVQSLRYLNHHPQYFMFSPLLYRLAMSYDQLVSRVETLAFLRGWLLGVLAKP